MLSQLGRNAMDAILAHNSSSEELEDVDEIESKEANCKAMSYASGILSRRNQDDHSKDLNHCIY